MDQSTNLGRPVVYAGTPGFTYVEEKNGKVYLHGPFAGCTHDLTAHVEHDWHFEDEPKTN